MSSRFGRAANIGLRHSSAHSRHGNAETYVSLTTVWTAVWTNRPALSTTEQLRGTTENRASGGSNGNGGVGFSRGVLSLPARRRLYYILLLFYVFFISDDINWLVDFSQPPAVEGPGADRGGTTAVVVREKNMRLKLKLTKLDETAFRSGCGKREMQRP